MKRWMKALLLTLGALIIAACAIWLFARTPAPKRTLTYEKQSDGLLITKYDGAHAEFEIPDTIDGEPVVALAVGAFARQNNLRTLTLPASIARIDNSTFEHCAELTLKVTPGSYAHWFAVARELPYELAGDAPPDITPVFAGAPTPEISPAPTPAPSPAPTGTVFRGAFDYLTYEDGTAAIVGCDTLVLHDITIPETFREYVITEIGDSAFHNRPSLTSVVIPDTVTRIGDNAFGDCDALTAVALPSNLNIIGDSAFSGCAALSASRCPKT